MKKNYDKLSEIIVKGIGGKTNILALTHCMTRLRFTLNDESKVDIHMLEKTDGVIKVLNAGGQYQVVIGNEVGDVYEAICLKYNLGQSKINNNFDANNINEENKGIINRIMNTISGILAPILGY